MKLTAGACAVLIPVFALILGLAAISGVAAPVAAAAQAGGCVTYGPIRGLSDVAAGNARIVAAAAERVGGPDGADIAVMVGYTESGLRILGNSSVSTGSAVTQGTGSNDDSLGIFQQRATWGTVAQRLDPSISTELFMSRLLRLSGWGEKQPWAAAQDVQRSAYDGHPRPANHNSNVYGGNYKANYKLARRVVSQIELDAKRQPCGTLSGGLPANRAPGSHGLPNAYTIPVTATAEETTVVAFAIAQLDKPYVFGAAGPDAFDCSGLTMAAWSKVGIALPHSSEAQASAGSPTVAGELAPGDLVLVPGDDGNLAAPGHVGLYIGHGLVLNAADAQDGIRVQTYRNFIEVGHGLAALRHIA